MVLYQFFEVAEIRIRLRHILEEIHWTLSQIRLVLSCDSERELVTICMLRERCLASFGHLVHFPEENGKVTLVPCDVRQKGNCKQNTLLCSSLEIHGQMGQLKWPEEKQRWNKGWLKVKAMSTKPRSFCNTKLTYSGQKSSNCLLHILAPTLTKN